MEKKYVKMNNNKLYLSLGNLFNVIKDNSKNTNNAMQVELFCSIFNINYINKTTINNYLVGYRPIGLEYKKIYLEKKLEYKKNKDIFIDIVMNILSILDDFIYKKNKDNFKIINDNYRFRKVCSDLIDISKNDKNISSDFINKLNNLYESNLYECFIELLLYSILENKQPIYVQEIEIDYTSEELKDYLKINLYEGISYITSLKELSSRNNMYANAELGSLEYSGLIDGKPNYEKSYYYYEKAALKNHPKACWMVANLILKGKVFDLESKMDVMWHFLNKAIKLGSVAAINTLGNCYKSGINPECKIDIEMAFKNYVKASESGYVYAFNNIGLLYEKDNKLEDAIKYYKISADLGESWALNKVGEYYRKNGDLTTAYYYYIKSIECPITERNCYGYYNLAKYYYEVGNKLLNIRKNVVKSNEYMQIFNNIKKEL